MYLNIYYYNIYYYTHAGLVYFTDFDINLLFLILLYIWIDY